MQTVTTIGFNIAKSVFQVHGVDADGQVLMRRQVETSACQDVFPEAATMPGWHRGVRLISLLGARKKMAHETMNVVKDVVGFVRS